MIALSTVQFGLRLLLAIGMGAIVGLERQWRQRMAGTRTAALVAAGAPFQWKTVPQGAATSVWAGVVAVADEVGGRYCENCHVGNIVPVTSPSASSVKEYGAMRWIPRTQTRSGTKVNSWLGSHFKGTPESQITTSTDGMQPTFSQPLRTAFSAH
jgi:MgtC family